MPVNKCYGAKIARNTTGWPSNTQGQTDISPGNLIGSNHVAHLRLEATKILKKKEVFS